MWRWHLDSLAKPGCVEYRRGALGERHYGCTSLDGKKIEPAPDSVIAALRHRLQIGASEMANFDPYFQDAMASTALENGRRGRIIAASRAAQRANNPHNSSHAIQSQHATPALQSVSLRRPSLDLFDGF